MDEERFAQALFASQEKFYRIAYAYVKNEHDALDVLSEAAYKGLKSLKSLKNPEYFDTWMTRIVLNAAADLIRRNSRVVHLEEETWEAIPVPQNGLALEDSLDIFQALDLLSAAERSCVILRYFEKHSFVTISQILNESESTVKSRLYRALNKMRKALQ